MKRIMCLISALAIAMSAYVNVLADDELNAKVEINGDIMKVYGKITSEEPKDVLLRVDRYGSSPVTIDNIDTECVYIEQKKTNSDGSFEFYCFLKEADQSAVTALEDFVPEKYVYSIGAFGNNSDVDSSVIEYYGKSYQNLVCKLINDEKTTYMSDQETAITSIKNILSQTYATLYVDAKIYEDYMTAPANYDSLIGYFAGLPAITEMSDLKDQLNEAASVTALKDNAGDVETLVELLDDEVYRESVGINSSSAVKSYNDFKSICGDKMVKAYANSTFDSLADSKAKFEFAVISTALEECITASQVKLLLDTNKTLLGVDASTYNFTDAEYVALSGRTISKLSDIKDAIDEIVKSRVTPPSSGESSSGTSSSGTSIPGSFGVAMPQKPTPVYGTSSFKDMTGFDWASESIEFLYQSGVISGKGDGNFAPQDNVTREEFLKMILSALGINKMSVTDKEFSDVAQDAWYAGYINAAYQKGIVSGLDEFSFGVGIPIKRENVTVIIYNALKAINLIDESSSFSNDFIDEDSISDYAKNSVSYMKEKGIISGYSDGSFNPAGNITRAESAVAVKKVVDYVNRFYKGGIN